MAEKVENLGDDLTCTIAVLLPCQHCFCQEWVAVYATKPESQDDGVDVESHGQVISCPLCRSSADLGDKGVAGLPVQLTLARIVEKYRGQAQVDEAVPQCSICEEEDKKPAMNFRVTCSLFYCGDCVALHPMRGVLKGHRLMTVKDYLSGQKSAEPTGLKGVSMDTSTLCDDHGQEILLFCGPCQRPLCKDCFGTHDSHPLKDISVLSCTNIENTRKKTAGLENIKDNVKKILAELAKFQADLEEKKSLHIAEIEKAYKETIQAVNKWRGESLRTTEERYEKWRLACVEATKSLELRMEEIQSLICSSKGLLSGPKITFLKGQDKLTARINDMTTSTEEDIQRHADMTAGCRDDFNSDAVIPRQLYVREEKISTPNLSFTETLSDCVLIEDDNTVLVSVNEEDDFFPGALTDGILQTRIHYWELDLTINIKKQFGKTDSIQLIYSSGVVRKGSEIGRYVGEGDLSWGVDVEVNNDRYMFVCVHNGEDLSTPVPVYPNSASDGGTVRQGFYLNC